MENQVLTPHVYWAQRHRELYLRVELSDVQVKAGRRDVRGSRLLGTAGTPVPFVRVCTGEPVARQRDPGRGALSASRPEQKLAHMEADPGRDPLKASGTSGAA